MFSSGACLAGIYPVSRVMILPFPGMPCDNGNPYFRIVIK